MCWMWTAPNWTRRSRCRSRDRTAQTASGGRKDARSSPTAWRVLQPLAVLDVGLPAGDVLHVPGVDQTHLEAAGLQDLVEGDPVHAGGLHRDRGDTALLQPVREGVQVRRERAEPPDGPRVSIERDAHIDLGGPDVDPRGVGVQERQRGNSTGAAASGHGGLLGEGEGHGRQAAPVVRDDGYSAQRDRPQTQRRSGRHQ
jgi:hypothetical protein